MPAACAPPVAVMRPPEMTMPSATRFAETPPPMPAAFAPPAATISPLSITILPGRVKPPAEPMPAAFWPPEAKSAPLALPEIVSVAAGRTSMPAEYLPAAVTRLVWTSVSVALRPNEMAGASVVLASAVASVSFLRRSAESAPLSDTTMRKEPFVERPCTSASAVSVMMPVDFA